MTTLISIVFIFCILCDLVDVNKLNQAGAVIKFCDPAYIRDCKAITRRRRRQEPYLTNMTSTTLQPLYNNVTLVFSFSPEIYGDSLTVKIKVCEAIKLKWMTEYLKKYSNIPVACPVAPGKYSFLNMELPAKNFPIPLPHADLNFIMMLELTETKYVIARCEVKLRT